MAYIRWFETLRMKDAPDVGGKNAHLGEMMAHLKEEGIEVPDGFALTIKAYWEFIENNHLKKIIGNLLEEMKKQAISLEKAGKEIRKLLEAGDFSGPFKQELEKAYQDLARRYHITRIDVAVRSSATGEDLPDASFAGQMETFLNVRGIEELLVACKKCMASLFTDRAISYREMKGIDHLSVALSIGVQKMVRADMAGAGVLFTLDPDTGFRDVVVIDAAWGFGENVAQRVVSPDEYRVYKPLLGKNSFKPIIQKTCGQKEKKLVNAKPGTENVPTSKREREEFVLNNEEILSLAKAAMAIEKHYKMPMDIEWAKDGRNHKIYIVQARPETVQSRKSLHSIKTYTFKKKGRKLLEGLGIGDAIVAGNVQVIENVSGIDRFIPGSILVTKMTSPDWIPIMKQAKGLITDRGGRTSHAAIISRELGLPAIVGTGNGTQILTDKQEITLSCAEGQKGFVYEGIWSFTEMDIDLKNVPKIHMDIFLNVTSPEEAMRWWYLPCKGIGLAQMEYIMRNIIKIHPMALVHLDKVRDRKTRKIIDQLTQGYPHKSEYFVDNLALGIGHIAASRYPQPVIVRMSDFNSNEYAHLIGGKDFEPHEENPMIGLRGASRYYNVKYREGFALECRAIKKAREELGFDNIIMMIPFCRTLEEADKVFDVMSENDLRRGENGLKVYVMAEIPSNVVLAEQFAERFDGFFIGSNDLTQLLLGVDRNSEDLASLYDQRNQAVKTVIGEMIRKAKKIHTYIGILGHPPSEQADFAVYFATFLMKEGIDSISLDHECVLPVIEKLAKVEQETGRSGKEES